MIPSLTLLVFHFLPNLLVVFPAQLLNFGGSRVEAFRLVVLALYVANAM